MDASKRLSKVRPLSLLPDAKYSRLQSQERDAEDVILNGVPNALADVDAIEREVDAQLTLLDPFATPEAVARATDALHVANSNTNASDTSGDAQDDVVDAFVSHQPQYKRSILAKKLQLYEAQLAVRDRQLTAMRLSHETALASIAKLRETIEKQQAEFDAVQDEWEDEKEKLLMRFRGASADGSSNTGAGAMIFQMTMGASAAAVAARTRSLHDADMQKQRELRLQMLRGAADIQDQLLDDDVGTVTSTLGRGASSWRFWKTLLRRVVGSSIYPFARDVRQIEARFGYSVASYFRFFRWIILSFAAISLPSVVLLVLHILQLVDTGRTFHANWVAFVGVFPAYLLFPMYTSVEAMRYTLVLLAMQAILLLFTVRKWIAEDRQSKTLEAVDGGGSKPPKFSRVVLNAWDFTTCTREHASDLMKSIAEQIKVTLQEELLAETLRRRTRNERYALYARRAASFLLYIVIQATCWWLILMVTTQASQIQASIARSAPLLAPYVSSIVPAAVTLINSVLPVVIGQLTALEKWDDVGFAIKAMVTRLYLAKVLNVLIQLVSYALLLDPYLFTGAQTILEFATFDGPTVRRNVMLAFKPELYDCRAEQVASGLLTLVVTDFTVSKVGAISSPAVTWVLGKAQSQWTRFRDRRRVADTARVVPVSNPDAGLSNVVAEEAASDRSPSAMPTESTSTAAAIRKSSTLVSSTPTSETSASVPEQLRKSEFQVPQKMVSLLYSCTIALVAIPLAPTAAVLALLLHVINFKLDKLFLTYFQKKPMTPWSAKDAGSFFIKFYFCTVLLFMGFTHFFLSNPHLPKLCDLQDALLSETTRDGLSQGLCLPESYNATTALCALDPAISRSGYFLAGSQSSTSECVAGYPKCVCASSLACGPFTGERNGYAPLLDYALSIRAVAAAYTIVASSAVVAWGVVLASAMGALFLRNSLRVQAMVARARDHDAAITFASLRKKIQQLENRLRIHKIGNDAGKSEDKKS